MRKATMHHVVVDSEYTRQDVQSVVARTAYKLEQVSLIASRRKLQKFGARRPLKCQVLRVTAHLEVLVLEKLSKSSDNLQVPLSN